MALLNPQLVRQFVDGLQTPTTSGQSLAGLALAFIGIAIARQLTSVSANVLGETVGWSATNALRTDLAAHVLELDMAFHTGTSRGALNECIDGDVTTLATSFTQLVIKVIGIVVAVAREDLRVGLVIGAFVLVALSSQIICRNLAIPTLAAGRSSAFAGLLRAVYKWFWHEETVTAAANLAAHDPSPLDVFW